MRICFVCLGNICRSPTAEAVVRARLASEPGLDEVFLDSAGMGPWHVGSPPDERARRAAAQRGVAVDGRGRQFSTRDFDAFDLVLAMDASNARDLRTLARDSSDASKIQLFLDFAPARAGESVPDPYTGGPEGFEEVLDLCEEAAEGLVEEIRRRLDSR